MCLIEAMHVRLALQRARGSARTLPTAKTYQENRAQEECVQSYIPGPHP